jgi:hypothetical protein
VSPAYFCACNPGDELRLNAAAARTRDTPSATKAFRRSLSSSVQAVFKSTIQPILILGVEACCSANPAWLSSSGLRPVFSRHARTSDIQRSADQNERGQVRSGPAACGPYTSDSAAVRLEAAMVQWNELRACGAFPVLGGSMQHSLSPMVAEDDTVTHHHRTSTSGLVVNIDHTFSLCSRGLISLT